MIAYLFALLLLASATPSPAIVGHESAVIDSLRPRLSHVGGAARIYYAAECRAAEYDTSGLLQLLFPAVYLQRPSQGAVGMDAVRQIFRDEPNLTVVQDRSGMVRITIGTPSIAVLQTRIKALTLNPDNQYSAPSAVAAIKNAPELYAAERMLDVHPNPLQISTSLCLGRALEPPIFQS
jgi:hypothetical protein